MEVHETNNFDELWDFSDPAATETRFRSLLDSADESRQNELLTQVARTYSLRKLFDEAHELLDQIAVELPRVSPRVEVRYLLERGRTWNSSGQREKATEVFLKAFDAARRVGDDHLTIDAAHMLGIVEEPKQALEWNLLALRIVGDTKQDKAKKWFGSLSNNVAWTYHDMGEYLMALKHFEEAQNYFASVAKEPSLRIARWAVARCRRSLGQFEAALAEQMAIAKDYYPEFDLTSAKPRSGEIDGYIPEEIAENLLALRRNDEAKPYFLTAFQTLSRDNWLAEREPERVARLNLLAK